MSFGFQAPLAPRKHRFALSLRSLAICVALLGSASFLGAREAVLELPLEHGQAVARSLRGGESHVYRSRVPAGGWWLLRLDQHGIDVTLARNGPDGERLVTVDLPTGRQGRERLIFEASAQDVISFEIEAKSPRATPGRYRLVLESLDASILRAPTLLSAERAMMAGAVGSFQATAESRRQAVEHFDQAVGLWHSLGARREQATALYAAAYVSVDLGEFDRATAFYQNALALWRSLQDRVFEAITLNDLGLIRVDRGDHAAARVHFEEAVALQQDTGNAFGEAVARSNLCYLALSAAKPRQALPCFERVLALHRASGALVEQARARINLGGTFDTLGEPRSALEHYREALTIFEGVGDRLGRAQVLNNLAFTRLALGEAQTALDLYGRALSIHERAGDRRWQGRVLSNLGDTYASLGDLDRAATFYTRALAMRRSVEDRRGEAITLRHMGDLARQRGHADAALARHEQALGLVRGLGDRWREASVLDQIGLDHMARGALAVAMPLFEQAIVVHREMGNQKGLAEALLHRGEARFMRRDLEGAEADLSASLGLHRALHSPAGEIRTRCLLARVVQKQGQVAEAIQHVEQALSRVEEMRDRIAVARLRATLVASVQEAYSLHIELLLHAGYVRGAFEASERKRARLLLDLLAEDKSVWQAEVEPDLESRRRLALEAYQTKASRRLALLSQPHSEPALAAATREVDAASVELDRVEAEMRRSGEPLAAGRLEPIRATAIQALLDSETVLLEYALGDRQSTLFWVDSDRIDAYDLPPRAELEALARQVIVDMRSVAVGRSQPTRDAAARLADILLGPVRDRLGNKRLAIAADGALYHLSFAALPLAAGVARAPLVTRHEVVLVASASALAAQRRRLSARRPAPQALAVFADPVFGAPDPRLVGERPLAASTSAERSLTARRRSMAEDLAFARLPATRVEAERIVDLFPDHQVLRLFDFDASRRTFLSGDMEQYRFVHLATHGVVDAARPELSGLVLSLVDRKGQATDGLVHRRDLADLRLRAELVVLSGCETALGQTLPGEGLMGLTHGFLRAGAARVVASRWRVADQVTAHLMELFYRSMLEDGLRPPAALRQAQIAIMGNDRWREPFHWAAFAVYGDWR